MRRCITSWPLKALALLLLLCLYRSTAAARLLPLKEQPGDIDPLAPHQDNGVTAAAADGLMIQEDEVVGDGNELSMSEMMLQEEAEQAVECKEGNDDECLQRRLLLYAHLDHRDYASRASRRRPLPPA